MTEESKSPMNLNPRKKTTTKKKSTFRNLSGFKLLDVEEPQDFGNLDND